jgi:HEPN domain-containing protein
MDPQAELLLRKAREDRAVLAFAVSDAVFGFHAQQAYEKLLKALIAARNVRFDRTHDLEALLIQLTAIGEGPLPLADDFPELQSFAVFLRYDDPEPENVLDRELVRSGLDVLIDFVAARMGGLERTAKG